MAKVSLVLMVLLCCFALSGAWPRSQRPSLQPFTSSNNAFCAQRRQLPHHQLLSTFNYFMNRRQFRHSLISSRLRSKILRLRVLRRVARAVLPSHHQFPLQRENPPDASVASRLFGNLNLLFWLVFGWVYGVLPTGGGGALPTTPTTTTSAQSAAREKHQRHQQASSSNISDDSDSSSEEDNKGETIVEAPEWLSMPGQTWSNAAEVDESMSRLRSETFQPFFGRRFQVNIQRIVEVFFCRRSRFGEP